jgi:hypothetical protein
MGSSAEKVLYRKSALIFEELGFLMPKSDRGFESQSATSGTYISFSGSFSGCLLVMLNAEALSTLACNMLGLDTLSDETVEQDALGEIANVICGNALPAVFGPREGFRLESPKLLVESDSAQFESEYCRIAKVCVPFGCGQADVVLYAEKRAASLVNNCNSLQFH